MTGESSETSKAVALGFFRAAFLDGRVDEAFDRYVADVYVQHNPQVPDGPRAARAFIEQLVTRYPLAVIDIKRVIAEDDLVAIHVHYRTQPDDRGMAGVDIFRVENGKVVEHWDVLQPVPAESANDNGML